jgi:hypothetical protein
VLKKKFLVCFVILLLTASFLGGCSSKQKAAPAGGITTGKAVVAATAEVGISGSTITVNKADSPINGLELTVPPNAYTNTRQFKISYEPIEKHTFGENFNPVSPVISIQNGGGYADEIVTMKIPVEIPEGQFAMAFYYDSERGRLEGIPVLEETADSITIATRHFSDIVAATIPESKLGIDAEVDTGFFPGVDDWQFTNYGSYIAPGGHCAGQSITALWYYTQMKSEGDPSLYGLYNEGTRDFWYDDANAYRFASTIQDDVNWDAWMVRYNKLKPKAQKDNSIVWKQFVYTMMLTGEPQFVYIQNTVVGGAHAMIAYGVSGGGIMIADPNYPGDTDRTIWFDDGEFEPYNSGANAQAILDGEGKDYDLILYFGTSSMVDFSGISGRWEEFEKGTIGNDRFPAYTVQTLNEDGDAVDIQDGYTTKSKSIPLFLDSAHGNLSVDIFREGEVLDFSVEDATYPLKPGNNQLGFYVRGDPVGNGKYKYVDFKYINVILDQPTTAAAGGDKPVITSFDGPSALQFDADFNVVGQYTFSVTVEGGTGPYYYIWKGARSPQVLVEGDDYDSITITPEDMRQPGAISDGFFLWVTVKDSKNQYATWGVGSTEFLYGLKFTGKFEVIDGKTVLVDNTWEVVKEP